MLEKFKNLNVKTKLNIGFSLLLIYMLIMSGVSIVFVYNLHNTNVNINSNTIGPYQNLYNMTESIYQQRVSAYNMALYYKTEPTLAEEELQKIYGEEEVFDTSFSSYQKNTADETNESISNIEDSYYNEFAGLKDKFIQEFEKKDNDAMLATLDEINISGDSISAYLEQVSEMKSQYSENQADKSEKQFTVMIFIMGIVIIFAVIAAWIIIRRITRSVRGPITRMSRVAGQVAESGNFNFSDKIIDEMKIDASYDDEVGLTTKAFSQMIEDLIDKKDVLEHVAAGDLTVKAKVISPDDTLGNSINFMIDSIRQIVNQIESASTQINKGAEQLSKGAQMLAQGSSEQSSNVEHLQNFINDVSDKAESSSDVSEKTSKLAIQIKDKASDGRVKMNKLKEAAEDVHLSSQSIEDVTKSIESIAFQTNILSLNAAIEAARAGTHGKGFSVVSDEVRNLAGKSSDAAGETATFVESSIKKTELGTELAKDATETFSSIADGVEEASALASELKEYIEAQKEALIMIKDTINQLSDVIHQNSSAAEETAASTEEMTTQTEAMMNLISGFTLNNNEDN